MQQSDPELDKYWVAHSGYFRLETIVVLGTRIIGGNLLLCHEIPEQRKVKKIPMR